MAATLDQYLNKRLEDPEFRREYEALERSFTELDKQAETRKACEDMQEKENSS